MNELTKVTNNYIAASQHPVQESLGVIIDKPISSIQLNEKEQGKIIKAFNAEMYDMSVEYIWLRTMNLLRDKLSVYGNDFIADMIGGDHFDSVKDISDVSIIDLAADIGIINQAARIEFKQTSELLYYYQSKQARELDHEELRKTQAQNIIAMCSIYVLAVTGEDEFIPYTGMRKDLQSKIIEKNSPVLQQLLGSPYFYIRTIARTMLNLSLDSKNPSMDIVLENLKIVLITVWEKLEDNDRWPIGIAYSQAVSAGNVELTKALRSVLNSIKGFDYVPESTKSDAYKKTAKLLLEKHKGFDNFYNEPTVAKMLANMGSTIPTAAIVDCLTSVLICKLGNSYGISEAAQKYLDEILSTVTTEKWVYFFNNLKTNDELLYELTYIDRGGKVLDTWCNLANIYSFGTLILREKEVNDLIQASVQYQSKKVKVLAKRMYDDIYKH